MTRLSRTRLWTPAWGVPPGDILREALAERGMSQADLARQLRCPYRAVNELINARRPITADTAVQLERALGITASFWLALEEQWQLQLAREPENPGARRDGSAT